MNTRNQLNYQNFSHQHSDLKMVFFFLNFFATSKAVELTSRRINLLVFSDMKLAHLPDPHPISTTDLFLSINSHGNILK